MTIWGALFAKFGSCINPIVYGCGHPKYQAELARRYPSLACAAGDEGKKAKGDNTSDATSTVSETSEAKP